MHFTEKLPLAHFFRIAALIRLLIALRIMGNFEGLVALFELIYSIF